MEEDYSDYNRVVGGMKLKMHSKISPNSRHREGGGEEERRKKKGEIEKGGEEEHALDFKTIML